jgi:hypothetical protein
MVLEEMDAKGFSPSTPGATDPAESNFDILEYGRLFLSAELAFRQGYMAGVSDMEIVRIGNAPPGETARWEQYSAPLKSWDPRPSRPAEASEAEQDNDDAIWKNLPIEEIKAVYSERAQLIAEKYARQPPAEPQGARECASHWTKRDIFVAGFEAGAIGADDDDPGADAERAWENFCTREAPGPKEGART